MNDYIFDWAENSEKILAGDGYTTKVHQTFEQIMLFAYLREKGYSKDEIFSLWIKTNSLLLQKIGDDKDQRDKYFGKLFADSTKYKIEKGNRIDIYQSEIDFINNMEVSMWIKQYVLAMLCIYKWYGKEWCVYNDKIKRFCYSCTDVKREKERDIGRLYECTKTYKPYITNIRDRSFSFKILFKSCEVIPVEQISNPRHIYDVMYLLENTKLCCKCGNSFKYGKNSLKVKMCPDCRKKALAEYKHNNYLKNKNKNKLDIQGTKLILSEKRTINPNKES